MKGDGKKKKESKRGIETMFRILSANHIRLSAMADNKSHIMITVNSIILSVIITVLLRRIEQYPHLALPSVVLLSVNLAALTFAVLATRPSVPDKTFTAEDFRKRKVNLMFFGNFHALKASEYETQMLEVMDDGLYLYKSLINDVYQQGRVLARKYRLLRISYSVFMYGIVVSVIAFIAATLYPEMMGLAGH